MALISQADKALPWMAVTLAVRDQICQEWTPATALANLSVIAKTTKPLLVKPCLSCLTIKRSRLSFSIPWSMGSSTTSRTVHLRTGCPQECSCTNPPSTTSYSLMRQNSSLPSARPKTKSTYPWVSIPGPNSSHERQLKHRMEPQVWMTVLTTAMISRSIQKSSIAQSIVATKLSSTVLSIRLSTVASANRYMRAIPKIESCLPYATTYKSNSCPWSKCTWRKRKRLSKSWTITSSK